MHLQSSFLVKGLLAISLAIMLPAGALAQNDKEQEAKEKKPIPEPKVFVTKHEGNFGGQTVKYTATAGETYLREDQGEPVASIWSVAYTRDGLADPSSRPVTFIFNGGPGSASVWLHMGFFGPRLAQVPSDADADDGAAPYPIINNDLGLLDLTDLVFIDPVGTGYSTAIGEGKNEDFWGLNEDARSIARFIRLWITEHQRWNAPKFITGESFGTTRAAGVTHELAQEGQDVAMNGLILISQALDYAGSTSVHDNIISFLTYLPSMAATAWYHGQAGAGVSLEEFVAEARVFTTEEYAPALFKGSALTEAQRNQVADRLAYFTGLDRDYILRSDLRVLVPRFQKELLRVRGLTVGRLDGRYAAQEPDQAAATPTIGDAASFFIESAYTAALNHHLATTLKVKMDRPYRTGNEDIYPKWNWRPVPPGQDWEPSYVNVARKLGDAMARNKDLKVLVANGYYDLITPFFDAEYTFGRNGIRRDRVVMKYYEGGHMMYTHQPDRQRLAGDIREFLVERLGK